MGFGECSHAQNFLRKLVLTEIILTIYLTLCLS